MRYVGRWLLWTFALVTAALVLLQGWYAAHIWWWRDHPPRETAFMAMRLAEIRADHPDARLAYTWVPYERISVELKRAMIAAEDARFIEHEGFDWDGIQQATRPQRAPRAHRCRRVDDHAATGEEPFPLVAEELLAQDARRR